MALSEYHNESPENIRIFDAVTYKGEMFTALSDAELDQWGDINVKVSSKDGTKWRTFSPTDKVTIAYEDDYSDSLASY